MTPGRPRRGPAASAGRHILGAYRSKHPETKLRRGTRPGAAPKQPSPGRGARNRQYDHQFLLFCIKHILSTGNLVYKDGPYWGLAYDVAGVTKGEDFPSLDACAEDLISALRHQYGQESEAA